MPRPRLLCAAVLALLALAAPPSPAGPSPTRLVFAVLPQLTPVEMHKNWKPVLDRLERETGLALELKLYDTMTQFESELLAGVPDLAFMTPFQHVLARRQAGYVPLVRSSRTIAGALFVRADSPVRSVADLNGKDIAFVGSRNVCSVFVRHAVREGFPDVRLVPLYSGTTSNVYKSVILGKATAGATLDTDLERAPSDVFHQLRTLYTTPKLAPHPVAAHPRVPAGVRAAVAAALLRMSRDSGFAEPMKTARLAALQEASYERDYRPLESVDYVNLSAETR